MRKIISWKQYKEMQPYSRQHIYRLEQQGLHPKRVRLGNNRIGWFEDELDAHIEKLAANR